MTTSDSITPAQRRKIAKRHQAWRDQGSPDKKGCGCGLFAVCILASLAASGTSAAWGLL